MKNIHKINNNIYITSDEEIKKGTWCLLDHNVGQSTGYSVLKCLYADVENGEYLFQDKDGDKFTTGRCDKIILTTDQDLINDSVQAIDDEFLEWFVKNKNREMKSKEEIEQLAEKYYPSYPDGIITDEIKTLREGFIKGYRCQNDNIQRKILEMLLEKVETLYILRMMVVGGKMKQ